MFCFSHLSVAAILCTFVSSSYGQQNITVDHKSPLIQYAGSTVDSPFCRLQENGTYQPGCYNVPSFCAESGSMGQVGGTGEATLKFKGSAIYINSVHNYWSPTFTVTLDGNSTEVDGVGPSGEFRCFSLFSQAGLNPNAEHQIRLSVKGPSPTRNQSQPNSEKAYHFSLVNFVYTEGSMNGTNSSATSSTGSAITSTSVAPNSGQELSGFLPFIVTLTMLGFALSL